MFYTRWSVITAKKPDYDNAICTSLTDKLLVSEIPGIVRTLRKVGEDIRRFLKIAEDHPKLAKFL